jgi:Glycosyltransferase family 25 (LPS biosynthesis protein)
MAHKRRSRLVAVSAPSHAALLLAALLAAAFLFVQWSPKSALPRGVLHTTDPVVHRSPWQPGRDWAANAAQRVAQDALLTPDLIHSSARFQPHLHVPAFHTHACQCPPDDGPPESFAGLKRTSSELTGPLPTPTRIALSRQAARSAHHDDDPPIAALFADVYVANLPGRADRQHYMCAILQHLRIPAILWPAFPRRHALVRLFAINAKNANFNPLMDYSFLRPPEPPQPPQHDSVADAASNSRSPARRKLPGPHLRTGEAACYLTHREIWLNIAQRRLERPVLVLEDDIEVEEQFVLALEHALRELPRDWAVLWVGSCFEEMHEHKVKVGHRCEFIMPACLRWRVMTCHTHT